MNKASKAALAQSESAKIIRLKTPASERKKRRPLFEELADALLTDIISGKYPAGSILPSESELAEIAGTSRLSIREAIKSLSAKKVVQVIHGRGTYVVETSQWSVLDPVLLMCRATIGADALHIERNFLEAREVIEVAVARLAAIRRSEKHLELMLADLSLMKKAHAKKDVDGFVKSDIAFHQRVMDAADNPFLAAIFDPLSEILYLTRTQTSRHAQHRVDAIAKHEGIYEAILAGDIDLTGAAMKAHMHQTADGFEKYVKNSADSFLAIAKNRPVEGLTQLRNNNSRN